MSGLAERLKHKRIVIWGTGNTGHAFYQEYRDKISLSVCTSSEENPKDRKSTRLNSSHS